MNILITGGAGYIGSHVALAFLDKNHNVTILDNLETGYISLVPKKAKFSKGDFSDVKLLNSLFNTNKFDALIHMAAYIEVEESVLNPEKYLVNNFHKSKILFDFCASHKLKNIVFSSTGAVYGNAKENFVNEKSKTKPMSPYAESKLLAEKYLDKISHEKDINYSILRFFNVAGADLNLRSGHICQKATHLIKIACEVAVNKKKNLTIFGDDYSTIDGTAIRDYIHVSDIADIHLESLNYILHNNKSETFNCGYGKGFTVKQVVKALNDLLDKPINVNIGPRRDGDVESLIADITKIRDTISWKPKYSKLSEILSSALAWEKNISKLKK